MKTKTSRPEAGWIQSLDRGLVILDRVARSKEPVSLGELTGLLEIDRSSVFRLANTLRRRGFLSYLTNRRVYVLGPSVWRLSHRYDWGTMLVRVSREFVKWAKSDLISIFGTAKPQNSTKQTIANFDRLARVCAQIREHGFATDDGEYQEGIRCIAAPIRAESGSVIGPIGISVPVQRFPKERYDVCGEQVSLAAVRISEVFCNGTRD